MNRRDLWELRGCSSSSTSTSWMSSHHGTKAAKPLKRNYFGKFDELAEENWDLDHHTKKAAIKASPFVVCLMSYTGDKLLFECSGTIMASVAADGIFHSTILTSATLIRCSDAVPDDIKVQVFLFDGNSYAGEIIAYDFHYNVAAIRIDSNDQQRIAPVKPTSFKFSPGMSVVALGRYSEDDYHIMAAPGELRLKGCGFDCEELLWATCETTKNGIGGPLINCDGDVIGISFYAHSFTPFLPIDIACICLERLHKYGEVPRPWLGLKMTDLNEVEVGELETLNQWFPNTFNGVIVKEVESGSPAYSAGICNDDIIVECDGKPVGNSMELRAAILGKTKAEPLPSEVMVKRARNLSPLILTLSTHSSRNLNRWPVPEEKSV